MTEHKNIKIGDAEQSVISVYYKVDNLKCKALLHGTNGVKQIRMGCAHPALLNKIKDYSITEYGNGYFRIAKILKTVNVE